MTHLILKNLPDSDVFKKQHDFLSSYLSEISINKGGTAKADLKKIEKNIIRIEADLRSKGQPTCQVIQSGRNHRTFQGEEKRRMKRNVEFATVRDILTRNAEAPVGTARRQATETVTVQTRKKKGEEHKVITEVNKNLPQDKGTSQNKEETLLTLRKTKAEG